MEPEPSGFSSYDPLVTVLYNPGALGDRSYNDLIYTGVERAAFSLGLRTIQLSPPTESDGLAILQEYFSQMCEPRDTVRRLLIVTGTAYEDYLREHSRKLEGNPRADLLYLETSEPLPGKGSTIRLPYYGAMYEAGAISCAFSQQTLLVAANPLTPAIQESVDGFTEGFNATYIPPKKDKSLKTEWLSDEAEGGFSVDDDTAMRILYADGRFNVAPLVFPLCGGASGTFYRMSDLFGGFDYIGIDAVSVSPHCPFSVVKHIDKAVGRCMEQWLSPDGMPKHQTFSFADGWTEVILHPYTDLHKFLAKNYLPQQLLNTIHEDALGKEAAYE